MCGIIGAVSQRDITAVLVEGLRRLEYRGYDSAGLAVLGADHTLSRVRVSGKVEALAEKLRENPVSGTVGIAHTRWATHGKPTECNAHPHLSQDEIVIVHNGIIENHDVLRAQCQAWGYTFLSETDSEVAVHLIHHFYKTHHNLLSAVRAAAAEMQGAFALGVMHKDHPVELVAIRKGCPLVLGIGNHEYFIASDMMALHTHAQSLIYLEEGDALAVTTEGFTIVDQTGASVTRAATAIDYYTRNVSKEGYQHFMLKEIYEQSRAVLDTCEGRLYSHETLKKGFGAQAAALFDRTRNIHIVACGTSYHAGLVAKYWLEALSGVSVQVDIASEYRYREVVVPDNTLLITISQSGETADTIAALRKAKEQHYLGSLAICNVPFSTLTRESDCVFLTRSGVEIGVASTKAFTTQLAALLMLSAALCPDNAKAQEVIEQLRTMPRIIDEMLTLAPEIKKLSRQFIQCKHMLFLGRGIQYPIALEGALKMKELSYIHAEGYPAGELKHGPLALVDSEMPVVAVVPQDALLDKIKSNLQEVSAREGRLYVFADHAISWQEHEACVLPMPACGAWITPIVYTIPLQLLSYYVACYRGTDVDQPRNLAKSVTVE